MIVLLILLVLVSGASAQECGNGLPCGPIPFYLPEFPGLQSPTPNNRDVDVGNLFLTPTVLPTLTPTATLTPSVTPTAFFDATAVDDNRATAQVFFNATEIPVEFNGTPVSINVTADYTLISYVKGLGSENTFGPFSPLISFFLVSTAVFIVVFGARYLVMVVSLAIAFVLKVIQRILWFIPGLGG